MGTHGWVDGRLRCCTHTTEFPLKERETLSWETVFLEALLFLIPQLQPSCFLGCRELPQASPSAVGTLSVLPEFPEAAGGWGGGRTVGRVPAASSQHSGDLSFLPSRSGKTASSLPSSPWPLRRRGEGVCASRDHAPPTRRKQVPTLRENRSPRNVPGKSQRVELSGAPPPATMLAAIGPLRPRPFPGRGGQWARAGGVTGGPVPSPLLRR